MLRICSSKKECNPPAPQSPRSAKSPDFEDTVQCSGINSIFNFVSPNSINPPSGRQINPPSLRYGGHAHQPAYTSLRQGRQINHHLPTATAYSPAPQSLLTLRTQFNVQGLIALLTSHFQIPNMPASTKCL
jgi:hypothetical protein